jgi:spermidine/putrescine-binding protein
MKPKRSTLFSVIAFVFVLALSLSACGGAAPATEVPPAEQTGTLTVLDWAGYDAEDFWVDFKNTYPKVTVNFEIGASDADIYSKMKAGDQAYLPSVHRLVAVLRG